MFKFFFVEVTRHPVCYILSSRKVLANDTKEMTKRKKILILINVKVIYKKRNENIKIFFQATSILK